MYQIKLCFKLEYSFLPKEMDRLFTSFLRLRRRIFPKICISVYMIRADQS